MPEEVAKKILSSKTGKQWVDRPTGSTIRSIACTPQNIPFSAGYKSMQISWLPTSVEVLEYDWNQSFFSCTKAITARISVNSDDDREDVIDALISLGAHVKSVR